MKDFLKLSRPAVNLEVGLMADLVWSDPIKSDKMFQPDSRGTGVAFNSNAVREFLMSTGYRCIVRGHENVSDGFSLFDSSHVITVFSSSGYDNPNDKAAIIHIGFGCMFSFETFNPIQFPKRSEANFIQAPELLKVPEETKKPQRLQKRRHSLFFQTKKILQEDEFPKIPKIDKFKFSFIWRE